jgi:hypothetical protein
VFYGILITGLAFIPIPMEPFTNMILDLFFIAIAVSGPMFLLGMFIPFANKYVRYFVRISKISLLFLFIATLFTLQGTGTGIFGRIVHSRGMQHRNTLEYLK